MHKLVNGIEVELTLEEIAEREQAVIDHEVRLAEYAKVAYRDERRILYPRIDEVVVALIEASEGRPEELANIQLRRAEVKLLVPKPQVD